MTNENELSIVEWQKLAIANRDELIRFKQSRIDLLESAIREFTNFVDPRDMLDSHARALNKLLELMEQAK